MTKIYYDEISLNRAITPGLSIAIKNLRAALEVSSMLNVPSDFKYRSYLTSLDNNIKENLNSVTGVYNKIKNSSKIFSGIADKFESEVSGIENYSITLRESAIK